MAKVRDYFASQTPNFCWYRIRSHSSASRRLHRLRVVLVNRACRPLLSCVHFEDAMTTCRVFFSDIAYRAIRVVLVRISSRMHATFVDSPLTLSVCLKVVIWRISACSELWLEKVVIDGLKLLSINVRTEDNRHLV